MKSQEAARIIIAHRARAIIVATMTAIKWLDQYDPEGLNLACVPLMGGAGALGTGIAIAQPGRNVLVLDGDGSLLMQLPTLVMSATARPRNLVHFVFNNGVWFENLANIPVPGASQVDFSVLAKGAGFKRIFRFDSTYELESGIDQILDGSDTTFVELSIRPESNRLWRQGNEQPDLPDFHFTRMQNEAHQLRMQLMQTETEY